MHHITRKHRARSSDAHQTLKNRILLENDFFPADLEAQIEAFVDHYNRQRYHESINNLDARRRLLRAGAINFKSRISPGRHRDNNDRRRLAWAAAKLVVSQDVV